MALKFDIYDIPFTGKLDQGTNPRLVPAGSFLTLRNCMFSRTGELAKRYGLVAANLGTGIPSATRFIRSPGGSLLVADGVGNATFHGAAYNDLSGTYAEVARLTSTKLRRRQMLADLGQSVGASDVAYCEGTDQFTVHVALLTPSKDIILRVVDSRRRTVLDQVLDNVSGSNLHVRATTSGSNVLVTFTGNSANALNGYIVDCSTAIPSVGGIITFTSAEEGTNAAPHDTCALGDGDGWAIAYRDNTTALKLMVYSAAGGYVGDATVAGISPLAIAVAKSGDDIYVACSNATYTPRRWTVHTFDTTPAVTGSNVWYSGVDSGVRISDVIPMASGVMLVHSERASLTDAVQVLRWCTCTSAPTPGTICEKRRPHIISKGWEKNTRCYIWTTDSGDLAGGSLPQDVRQPTAALLELTPLDAEPAGEAVVVGSSEYLVEGDNVTGDRKASSTPTVAGWATALRGRHIALEYLTGSYEVETTFDGTFQSVEFGGSTYIAGGVLYQWDGARCFEVGFPQRPALTGTVTAGSGTWDAAPFAGSPPPTPKVQYYALYEVMDNTGARHRSVLSNSYQATLTAATNEVDLELEPLTISRRHWGDGTRQTFPRVIVSIYRSSTPGDVTNLVRLKQFTATPSALENDPLAMARITFTDTGASTSGHELLYTVGGQLENDLAEPCDHLFVHRDRLWAIGGVREDTVRISKTYVRGEPAQFSIGLEVMVPGERVTAGASLDSVAILFTETGIHKVFGDGPDDTGNPATGQWSVEPVASDMGCIQPRSVVSTPFGIVFRSARGFYLLDRGYTLQFIGADVQDLTDDYPTVYAATVVASANHVRFLVGSADASRVLVFDYAEKKWLEWDHSATGKFFTDAAHDGTSYHLLANDGGWYTEEVGNYTDANLWYGVTVRTGWLPFAHIHGRKRLRRMVASGEYKGTHNLRIRYYLEKDPYLQEWLFYDKQLAQMALYQVRVDPRWQLGQTYSWEFIEEMGIAGEEMVADTEGFTLTGMSAMVGHMGRLRPMPGAASK